MHRGFWAIPSGRGAVTPKTQPEVTMREFYLTACTFWLICLFGWDRSPFYVDNSLIKATLPNSLQKLMGNKLWWNLDDPHTPDYWRAEERNSKWKWKAEGGSHTVCPCPPHKGQNRCCQCQCLLTSLPSLWRRPVRLNMNHGLPLYITLNPFLLFLFCNLANCKHLSSKCRRT